MKPITNVRSQRSPQLDKVRATPSKHAPAFEDKHETSHLGQLSFRSKALPKASADTSFTTQLTRPVETKPWSGAPTLTGGSTFRTSNRESALNVVRHSASRQTSSSTRCSSTPTTVKHTPLQLKDEPTFKPSLELSRRRSFTPLFNSSTLSTSARTRINPLNTPQRQSFKTRNAAFKHVR